MGWLKEITSEKMYRNILFQWLGVAEKRERYSYYLHLYFNSEFKILRIDTNLIFISNKKHLQLLPKTLYRFVNYSYHESLLQLYFKLKYVAPKEHHKIYLIINSKLIKAKGRLKVLEDKDSYKLKLRNIIVLPDAEIRDNYQEAKVYFKEIAYKLYDKIYQAPLYQTIKIAAIMETNYYSKSTLYNMFQKIIGVPPSLVWRNRRLIKFKQYLLETNEPVKSIYWKFGFANKSVLHRNFKKAFHLSPLAFRKKYQTKSKK